MEAQSYNLKVKNTFLEVDVDDDALSNFSIDEDEGPKRQMTEPVPCTIPLLTNNPQCKPIHSKYGVCYFDRQESTASSERSEEATTSSEHDIKESSERLDESTASSEHDVKETNESPEHDLQSESEPDFAPDTNGMDRQVTEELCWNVWSEQQWELGTEQSYTSPHFSHTASEQYTGDPRVHTIAAAALLGHAETPEDRSTDRRTSRKKGGDADGSGKTNTPRRRKRESLIDIAARKQKQQPKQEKHLSQQGTSNAQPCGGTRSYVPKSKVAAFCPQCGGKYQVGYKFCKFCGFSLPLSLL